MKKLSTGNKLNQLLLHSRLQRDEAQSSNISSCTHHGKLFWLLHYHYSISHHRDMRRTSTPPYHTIITQRDKVKKRENGAALKLFNPQRRKSSIRAQGWGMGAQVTWAQGRAIRQNYHITILLYDTFHDRKVCWQTARETALSVLNRDGMMGRVIRFYLSGKKSAQIWNFLEKSASNQHYTINIYK